MFHQLASQPCAIQLRACQWDSTSAATHVGDIWPQYVGMIHSNKRYPSRVQHDKSKFIEQWLAAAHQVRACQRKNREVGIRWAPAKHDAIKPF